MPVKRRISRADRILVRDSLAIQHLTYNLNREWVPLLLQEYGIEEVDDVKLEFYKLLDEFF